MKVLFVFYVPSGGMETLNRIRSAALQKNGIHCHLLYLKKGAGLQNPSPSPVHVGNKDLFLKRLLVREKFSLIVVTSDSSMLRRLRRLGYRGPLVFEGQGFGTRPQAVRVLNLAARNVKTYANGLLYPPTSHLAELFQQIYPKKRHFSFSNPFPAGEFTYRPLPPLGAPVAAWIGRIEANKNWEGFLEIGSRLIARNPAFQLYMFLDTNLANPKENSRFYRTVNRLNLTPHLHLIPNVPHASMADYLSQIGDSGGLLVSTSRLEGFGFAVLEAMSCRCPVLTSDSDGVRHFVVHDVTGKYYPADDYETAAVQAAELIEDAVKRESIRSQARDFVASRFSPEGYAAQFAAMAAALGAK
ncbi:glycosyltransferase family 4 protein [Gorillibacterium sp. CAU 1737]|uniref:glycosyltransferase family 4 protein n=1 Tax=Gorillibacterium sp. CAU 1737 TaxID=3140362 RepID=UPI00326081C5